VNSIDFALKHSVLFYITMEFQMMHEYISHLLPSWNSGNVLEEEFLLALMFLYYREEGSRNGLVSLVREADRRRADRHRQTRERIKDELAAGRERELTRLVLQLAVLDESEMNRAEKRKMLALLKKVPSQTEGIRRSFQDWLSDETAPGMYRRLSDAIRP
jgi:hypothetical protein